MSVICIFPWQLYASSSSRDTTPFPFSRPIPSPSNPVGTATRPLLSINLVSPDPPRVSLFVHLPRVPVLYVCVQLWYVMLHRLFRTQIGMFRPIRIDHTNCLQVAIKSIQIAKTLSLGPSAASGDPPDSPDSQENFLQASSHPIQKCLRLVTFPSA
jgi:hypothetical protein